MQRISLTNHLSRMVYKYEVDGKGYAFSYDDVNPSEEDQSLPEILLF